ncbi:hypothetical protein ENSA7_78230 [Enhygromyxa salina]|uniref:Uncharacterized protein n=1 Tax=Enhygromyxa salina TaxID=215803 RepID=A0A2S9XN31_9BACT|nr:hypothetical protein ENSA7_78230 [Enhygromyxa salina]
MPTVELTAQAGQQLAQAREWWHANRDKAPHAVDDEMHALAGRSSNGRRCGECI